MIVYYMLDKDGNPVPTKSFSEWGRFMEDDDARRLAWTEIADGVRVSTIFLGLDRSFGEGPPFLWETMIFGGPHDEYGERYCSREDALRGHEEAVALARSAVNEDA